MDWTASEANNQGQTHANPQINSDTPAWSNYNDVDLNQISARIEPSGNNETNRLRQMLLPNTAATRAAASIVSFHSLDYSLTEIPNHLWGLECFQLGKEISARDLTIVHKGWMHMQRMDQKFSGIFKPTAEQFIDGVEYLKTIAQQAANEYTLCVERAIISYVNQHFVLPDARSDAEAVEFSGNLDTIPKVCRRVRASVVRAKDDVRWINWYHLYQLLKGLWEERVGNMLSPKNFVYSFLKKKGWKMPDISRTELSNLDKAFLGEVKTTRRGKTNPYKSPLVQRLASVRNKKMYEKFTSHASKETGLLFMIDLPRGKILREKTAYHTWEGLQGNNLFYLYEMGSHTTAVSATSQRKRDLQDVSGSVTNRIRVNQPETELMDDIPRKIRMVEEALGGRPTVDVIIQICNGMHGPGAYLNWIRENGPCTIQDQQVLSRMFPDDEDNEAYNIFCGDEVDLDTGGPSTLTGSVGGLDPTHTDTAESVEGMLALTSGVSDDFLFATGINDPLDSLETTQTNPTEQPEKEPAEKEKRNQAVDGVGDVADGSLEDNSEEKGTKEFQVLEEGDKEKTQKTATQITKHNDRIDDCHKSIGDDRVEQSRGAEDSKENTLEDRYNVECYERTKEKDVVECACCENSIEPGEELFKCKNCKNGHVLCDDCMTMDNNGLEPSKCTHANYDDSKSYEMCISHTYSWMNKDNKQKQCSTCGKSSKPTTKLPFYYCKHCRLHRVCTTCWNAEILKEDGNYEANTPGNKREGSRRKRTTRTIQ